MKVIYADVHRRHSPSSEFVDGEMKTHAEAPARAETILRALQEEGLSDIVAPRRYPFAPILAVHDVEYLHYLEKVYAVWVAEGRDRRGVVPDTFAVRRMPEKPAELIPQAGYYCFDTQTPVMAGTYEATLSAAYCALTGADMLLLGAPAAYALCRPPGHHAGRGMYGGYCYLNNVAVAATQLAREDRVAILDIDYHHGNGTQEIFYDSDRVLYVSIHGDPNRAYPFFSGFANECGVGLGEGFNRNFPLPARMEEGPYLRVLGDALEIVRTFSPGFLVVSIGGDILRGDPWGDFHLSPGSFARMGARIAELELPTLLVQEGGYSLRELGEGIVNALRAFS